MIAESTTIVGELETSLGVPTFAFFANWSGEYSIDADEEAGRLLTSMIISRLRIEKTDQVALILGARGGYPAFADRVVHTMKHLGVELQVVVPCRIDGAAGLVAAAADYLTIHPQAGIGAIDGGLCIVPRRAIDASVLTQCQMSTADFASLDEHETTLLTRLANDQMIRREQRQMAEHIGSSRALETSAFDFLLEANLGEGLTVGRAELKEAGIDTRVALTPLAEQLEDLLNWARTTLHLFESPEDRFQISDSLADEVEFEPATLIPAAAIIDAESVWLHELDTGSPDPDAPRLLGEWRAWDPQENQASL